VLGLRIPRTERELIKLVGGTVIPKGIGGEKAFRLFREIFNKYSVVIDHPRHIAFVAHRQLEPP